MSKRLSVKRKKRKKRKKQKNWTKDPYYKPRNILAMISYMLVATSAFLVILWYLGILRL